MTILRARNNTLTTTTKTFNNNKNNNNIKFLPRFSSSLLLRQVPFHLSNFSIKMRSFFCGKVESGYISSRSGGAFSIWSYLGCTHKKSDLSCSLGCSAGQLLVKFPSGLSGLPFARCMQVRCVGLLAIEKMLMS